MKTMRLIRSFQRKFTSGYGYMNPKEEAKTRYASSINDKLVWINIENMGKLERIAAIEGESLLTSLLRFKVNNLPGFI